MKIVTWNCNGALRNKLDEIDSLSADLYVIQECENPALSTKIYREWAGNYLWIGDNKSKGLGVFPKNENDVNRLNWHGEYQIEGIKRLHSSAHWKTSDLRLFLPFQLNEQYTMLGVWTKRHGAEVFGYIGQLWKYIQIHGRDLCHQKTLILGDFNSNSVWDKPDRWWSHSGVVQELKGLNLYSLYHDQEGEKLGDERQPTFYLQRNLRKPYHIDYVFISNDLIGFSEINIGGSDKWLPFSDHMPLTVTITTD